MNEQHPSRLCAGVVVNLYLMYGQSSNRSRTWILENCRDADIMVPIFGTSKAKSRPGAFTQQKLLPLLKILHVAG